MSQTEKTITINALIDIMSKTIELIVENEKQAEGLSGKIPKTVDTAGKVGELISHFLLEKDFHAFASDRSNYIKKQKIVF